MPLLHIDRTELKNLNPVLINKANSFSQADIFLVTYKRKKIIIKDFSRRPWIFRVTMGQYILNHEVRALQILEDIPTIPSFLGMVDKNAFFMEMVHGIRLPRKDSQPPSMEALTELQSIVDKMHSYGVTHNDIRRTNIILSHDGRPYLIDFATSMFKCNKKQVSGVLRKTIFNGLCRIDNIKALKLKQYYYENGLSLYEEKELKNYPLIMKGAEMWRKSIYRPFLKQARWKERFDFLKNYISKGYK